MSLTPFSSQIIADVGISFGDEGKGRLIPEVAEELRASAAPVSVVLKVNGGANSGHTAGGIKLNLLPAGVAVPTVPHLCIGSGVVADPRKIWWEARPLEQKGYAVLARLLIDERTLVSDFTHRLLDLAWEDYRTNILAEEPRGSTGRGITPAYLDEVGQWQITFSDFHAGRNWFARKLAQRADRALRLIQHVCRVSPETFAGFFDKLTSAEQRANGESVQLGVFDQAEFDFTRFRGDGPFALNLPLLTEVYWQAGTALARNIGEVRELILRELGAGRTVIGEFGQSYWLDKRHGYSPNVTASCGRVFCQSRMQGGQYPSRQGVQSLRPRGAQGLDRPGAEGSENHPPSRMRHVRCRWRHDQAEVENAIILTRQERCASHPLKCCAA